MNTTYRHKTIKATCVFNGVSYIIQPGSVLLENCDRAAGMQRYAWKECIRNLVVVSDIVIPTLQLVHNLVTGVYIPPDKDVEDWVKVTDE